MNKIPIVFAFDSNVIMPACVCISSLLINAKEDTFYDIFILYPDNSDFNKSELEKLSLSYSNFRITFRPVGNLFNNAFEIRKITYVTYYRLLIPQLIPEYDKILYSDVDVIFREDLSDIYMKTDMTGYYIAGVKSLSEYDLDRTKYYTNKIGISPEKIAYDGNMIINSALIMEDNLIPQFLEQAKLKYKYQEMDIINIVCKDKIKYISLGFCLTIDQLYLYSYDKQSLTKFWSIEDINHSLKYGIVHYNGPKPWKEYCINFDIWWEYYRKSPFYNEKFYFDFYYNKLELLDRLSLLKRIKILLRYFVYGIKK